MKKLTYLFLFVVSMMLFSACRDQQTYADQKNREHAAINKFLAEAKSNSKHRTIQLTLVRTSLCCSSRTVFICRLYEKAQEKL